MEQSITEQTQEQLSIRAEIIQKMTDLATAAFGLVAALAWNDAIKALFDAIFPKAGNIIAQFVYAGILTIIIVLITVKLGKIAELAKHRVILKNKEK